MGSSTNDNVGYFMRGNGDRITLPLTFVELKIGQYGVHSYRHPTDLPVGHRHMCSWANEGKRLVTHNRTGTLCRLDLPEEFYAKGDFKLIPSNGGETMLCRSEVWTSAQASLHLDSCKGVEFIFEVKIVSIYWDESRFVDQVVINKFSSSKIKILVASKWPSVIPIPVNLINKIA